MALLVQKFFESYDYYFNVVEDPRSKDFFLMETPPILFTSILIGYLMMIEHGPKLMATRKPFELKTILLVYNFTQVVLNVALGVYATWFVLIVNDFNFECQPIDYSNTVKGITELKLCYCYFLLKILDLLDTLFIILKRNNSQLSFLHCYHHFIMAFGIYVGFRWIPGGHTSLLGIINLFVHGFMYFYFFLTAFKPEIKKSMWWKRHITQIQMIQFAILIVHFFRGALARNCSYPKFWLWALAIQNIFMFTLFADFYKRAYWNKRV